MENEAAKEKALGEFRRAGGFGLSDETIFHHGFDAGYDARDGEWKDRSREAPTEVGEYLLKMYSGEYILRYMRDEIDYRRRDYSHWKRITPPEQTAEASEVR